jgi:ribonucleotide reductase alpha subunit
MKSSGVIGPRNLVSQQLHEAKYRQRGESFDDYCVRYARTTADDARHFRDLLYGLRTQAILPAGRQQRAVGWPFQTTAFNCFVGGTLHDSMSGIMDELKNSMMTLRSGGGDGWDFSPLRPQGWPVYGLGDDAYSSGPVSFMPLWHSGCSTIRSAGERRGAMMGVLNVHHPDIMSFVRCKANGTSLTNFNISVGVTDEFMQAVQCDGLYELRFPVRPTAECPTPKVVHTVRALDVWAAIMENNWDWAEPGVLFLDTINRMNPLQYCEYICATNPCFTGDTKVWTAYGPKTFRELAESGRPIPVLTQLDDGRLVYRQMIRPRRTQRNAKLVRVRLRGSGLKAGSITTIRCTPEHVFYLRDGRKVMAKDLRPGDRIASCYRGKANQKGYIALRGSLNTVMEHHVSAEYKYHRWPNADEDVHHRNGIRDDNRIENVEILTKSKHSLHHIGGINNPMVRFPEKNPFSQPGFAAGENNGRYRHDLDEEEMIRLRAKGYSYGKIARKLGCSKYTVMKRLAERLSPEMFDEGNHTVVSVRPLREVEDVYCGTVPSTGRFFVWCGENEGVLVSNCGEQPLPPDGACLLLSHNLVKYLVPSYSRRDPRGDMLTGIHDPRLKDPPSLSSRRGYEVDLDRLAYDVSVSVRACDNVFESTVFPLEAQRKEALAKRRMGVGAHWDSECPGGLRISLRHGRVHRAAESGA